MLKTVFFLATLIAFSTCASHSNMKNILNSFAQLNDAAGNDKVSSAMVAAQISAGVNETSEAFNKWATSIAQTCSQGKSQNEGFIKKVEEKLTALSADKRKAEAQNESLAAEVASRQADMKSTRGELRKVEGRIHEALSDLAKYGSEAEQKLVVVKYLRDIITDELIAEQKHAPNYNSFVQVKAFSDKVAELKGLLAKSGDAEFTPLVSTLVELAEGRGFADQGVLQKIMAVLGKLDANLRKFRENQDNAGRQNIENLKKEAESFVNQLKSSADLLRETNIQIAVNNEVIKMASQNTIIVQNLVNRRKSTIDGLAKLCTSQKDFISEQNNFFEHVREDLGKFGSE